MNTPLPPGAHYVVSGPFVVAAEDGRRLTMRAAYERARQMQSAAVSISAQNNCPRVLLEKIDDCFHAASILCGSNPPPKLIPERYISRQGART